MIYGKNLHEVQKLQSALNTRFEMTDLGSPKHYLGKTITRSSDTGSIHLDLHHYTQDLIQTYKPHILQQQINDEAAKRKVKYKGHPLDLTKDSYYFNDIFRRKLPMSSNIKLQVFHSVDDPLLPDTPMTDNIALHGTKELYQRIMGKLTFLQCQTRPDIAFAVNALSRYKEQPCRSHWACLIGVLQYLNTHSALGLTYSSSRSEIDHTLFGYCDSDWAGDSDTRKSTSGYLFKLAGGTISASSKRQKSVNRSATEAEFFAAADALQEALWIRKFLLEAGFPQMAPTILFEDNQGCIAISENGISSNSRLRHVDLRMHFVEEHVAAKEILLKYVPTKLNLADLLTKNVTFPVFDELVSSLISPGIDDTQITASVSFLTEYF